MSRWRYVVRPLRLISNVNCYAPDAFPKLEMQRTRACVCVCVCVWCVCSAVSECKLLLWWFKMVELCLRQVDFGAEHRRVVKVLLNVIPALMSLGEDKSSAGLLGAIGFGRRSALSHRWDIGPSLLTARWWDTCMILFTTPPSFWSFCLLVCILINYSHRNFVKRTARHLDVREQTTVCRYFYTVCRVPRAL